MTVIRPLERVLTRLQTVRKNSRGWVARCPAHDDHGPSLSITAGDDGRVLLNCFAGCSAEAIAVALGLSLRDLFADRRAQYDEHAPLRRDYAQAPLAAVQSYIEREVERQRIVRIDRHPYDTPNVRSSDVNEARRRAGTIFEIQLAPVARFAWEGWAPHDTDPSWPDLFARALEELAWELHHFREPSAQAWETCELPSWLRPLAADRAVSWLPSLSKQNRVTRAVA